MGRSVKTNARRAHQRKARLRFKEIFGQPVPPRMKQAEMCRLLIERDGGSHRGLTRMQLLHVAAGGNVVAMPAAAKLDRISLTAPTKAQKEAFYASWEWRTARQKVLQKHGRECLCCGARPGQFTTGGARVRLVVDHIKPISKHWHLRLDQENLQVLCDECNQGKGAWDETDYRAEETA